MLSYGSAKPSLCLLWRFDLLDFLLPFHVGSFSYSCFLCFWHSFTFKMNLCLNCYFELFWLQGEYLAQQQVTEPSGHHSLMFMVSSRRHCIISHKYYHASKFWGMINNDEFGLGNFQPWSLNWRVGNSLVINNTEYWILGETVFLMKIWELWCLSKSAIL